MAVLHLLDTNIASYVIKGKIPSVDRRMAKLPIADVFISTVAEAELRHGLARRPDASRLQSLVEDFLLTVTILPWDSAAAKQYGRLCDGSLRAGRKHDGLPMANLDMMIGACCRQ